MMIKVLSVAFRKMKKKKCKTSKCFRAQEKRVNAVTLIEDFCHFVCFSRHIFLPLSQELQDMSAFFKYFWFFSESPIESCINRLVARSYCRLLLLPNVWTMSGSLTYILLDNLGICSLWSAHVCYYSNAHLSAWMNFHICVQFTILKQSFK